MHWLLGESVVENELERHKELKEEEFYYHMNQQRMHENRVE